MIEVPEKKEEIPKPSGPTEVDKIVK